MALQLRENATYIDYVDVKFLPVWAGIQILTAFATLFAYCVAGCRVNEMVMYSIDAPPEFAPECGFCARRRETLYFNCAV